MFTIAKLQSGRLCIKDSFGRILPATSISINANPSGTTVEATLSLTGKDVRFDNVPDPADPDRSEHDQASP